ncbi:MAG TPA: response regulator transcription factor [Candidatus Angelobacter sp.]|nr:response regulator transcription factor [Candidatus Angelobacter sp.]
MNTEFDKRMQKSEGHEHVNGDRGRFPNLAQIPHSNHVQVEDGVIAASILLADDCSVIRRGVRTLLESQPNWKVVAEAGGGREAVSKATQLRPDVIILSVSMPELNGLDATRLILKALPQARVLVLTSYETEEMIERALQAGVRGYVLKSDAEADLVAAVKALLQGRTFYTSVACEVLVEHLRREGQEPVHSGLTVREAEIVQLLAEGNSNKQVAGVLDISSRTVENHRAQIMQRLGMHSFSELIRYAIRIGIVEP